MLNVSHETTGRFLSNPLHCFFLAAVLIILFVSAQEAYPYQVTLAWDANKESDLAGYKIHYGRSSRNYTSSVDVGNKTRHTIKNLKDGVIYYFAATAYDKSGNESDFSKEVASDGSSAKIIFQAENGYIREPMVVAGSDTASGGKYIWVPAGKGNLADASKPGGFAEYTFRVRDPGRYFLWGRVMAPNKSDNSFFVSMDSGEWVQWDTSIGAKRSWIWDRVTNQNRARAVSFDLKAGEHTLIVKQRKDGTKIDRILLSKDKNYFGETVYEDAEAGNTRRWDITDADPAGAQITNVYDNQRGSNVILLKGSGTQNAYRLRTEDGKAWNNKKQRTLEWSMKYSEPFIVRVAVSTTAGWRWLTYKPVAGDKLGKGKYVNFGLGGGVKDGKWHKFARNLQKDLERAQPGVKIEKVNAFIVRGSGKVDDIKLR